MSIRCISPHSRTMMMDRLYSNHAEGRSVFFSWGLLAALLIVCMSFGCIKEDETSDCPNRYVTLELSVSELQGAMRAEGTEIGTPEESSLTVLRVMEFAPDGKWEATKIVDDADFLKSVLRHDASIVMKVNPGRNKTVVVVANENADLKNKLDRVRKLNDLPGIVFTGEQHGNAIVMVGQSGHDAEYGVVAYVGVALTRVFSKISLYMAKADKVKDKNIVVTSVRLKGISSSTNLIRPVSFPSVLDNPTEKVFSNITSPITINGRIDGPAQKTYTELGTIYIFETLLDRGVTGFFPLLEIEGTIDGLPTTFRGAVGTDDHYFSRNTHYILHASARDFGEINNLLITAKVMPWNYIEYSENYEELVFVTSENNKDFAMGDDAIHEASYENPLKFFVRVKGYPGTEWKATMDNGFDFEFIGPSWGRADGIQEVCVTIRPRRRKVRADKKSRVYFSVNGHIVPNASFVVLQKAVPEVPDEEE